MKNCLVSPRVKSGFTLIEILVVIGIIALLAALVFPVFSRVRESGRTSICSNNMRQLGLAFTQYVADNGNRYPFAGNYQNWAQGAMWVTGGDSDTPKDYTGGDGLVNGSFTYVEGRKAYPEKGALYPYVKDPKVYICPSDKTSENKRLSYSMNCAIGAMGSVRIKQPADIILLVDEGRTLNDGFFYAVNQATSTDTLSSVHNGGGNILFTDGHVKFYPFGAFTLDSSTIGLANKWRTSDSPRFHDKAFGPNGSNLRAGKAIDVCLVPATTPPTTPTPVPTPI